MRAGYRRYLDQGGRPFVADDESSLPAADIVEP
jgi:hypothetical protein